MADCIVAKMLAASPLFQGCSVPEGAFTVLQYRAGQVVHDTPKGVPSVGAVAAGRIDVYSVAVDGRDVWLNSLYTGECFGIYNLVAASDLETVLCCGEDTVICYIDKVTLRRWMETDQKLAFQYAALCNAKLQFLIKRIEQLTTQTCCGKIAAVPANVSSVLYNNNSAGFQVLAINTLGVLYIVESGNTVQSMEDLRGKTIYASGKGATPEYALNYILSANGIDPTADVTIEWKSEHAECLSALMAQENAIAMLPQPFVTTAQTKSDQIRVALDLTQEWDALQEGNETPSALITGVVVARREFVEQNPDAVSAFLDHYKTSVEYVNSNTDEAAQLVGQYEIVTAEVAEKALPACNITFIEGKEMQEKLSGYLAVLFEQNPRSIGGALPGDDFYFSR